MLGEICELIMKKNTAYTTDFFYYETPFLKKAYEKNKMLGVVCIYGYFSQKEDLHMSDRGMLDI